MLLENYIRERRDKKEILLMTHIVIGYPSLQASFELVQAMVEGGVDLMELQIPFSEPIADGPVILRANQASLAVGTRVSDCLQFAEKAAARFQIPFLFMTYYNILFKYGVQAFVAAMAQRGLHGAIVPDLPYEEGAEYLRAMQSHQLAPIFIYAPTSSDARMRRIAQFARGFVYCVARKGVTGQQTDFSEQLHTYLARCRNAVDLPLALGFGVKDKADVDFLAGKVDIAVIGTQTIRVLDAHGVEGVRKFVEGLKKDRDES
jgi:tryptophan synthase alpha chain